MNLLWQGLIKTHGTRQRQERIDSDVMRPNYNVVYDFPVFTCCEGHWRPEYEKSMIKLTMIYIQ